MEAAQRPLTFAHVASSGTCVSRECSNGAEPAV
eukprot:CAMPEP_0177535952 /NCGR_PEP_ID=MMETSP0369-20130122/56876_1 /TAXON_ID=447022 ORGANISM="Scrippsiella hangoei-like, Strain SHHI-4" /NCGR_SAMPLE_ID=MMETSP0369 /ASSEMBLY_ACC=CAM_ASM_000364 /LENGTH=32 /DNA_ID= /DNA_START= /DNA_END= /DNA_ORIENTATION=